jgi:aspartate kinase
MYLTSIGIDNLWFDARDYVITDENHKESNVVNVLDFQHLFSKNKVLVTQGFIGRNEKGENTVLGFDGSDESAAQMAVFLKKNGWLTTMHFHKDVNGVYDKDPFKYPNARLHAHLTPSEYEKNYTETGFAPVLSKSIKFLAEYEVPIWISSYVDLEEVGTLISSSSF